MEEITFDVDEVTKEPKQRKKKPKQEYVDKKPRSFSVEMMPMADIKPSLANERLHPADNIKYLVNGISEFDMQKPIVIDSDNVIIAGHGIYTALLNQGYTHINVVRSDLKGNKKKAFRVFDNKSGELSKWDDEKLSNTLYELHSDGYAIADYGFESSEYDKPQSTDEHDAIEDNVPEVAQNVYGVQRGDIWQLGKHRLMCGDSTSESDVTKLMDGSRAVFSFTSPPYAEMREYNGGKELSTKHLAKFLKAPCDLFAVNLGIQRKDNEISQYWEDYIQAAKEYGHKFLSWNIWDKLVASGIGSQMAIFPIEHEWIFIFGIKKELNKTVKNKYSNTNVHGNIRNKDGSKTDKTDVNSTNRKIKDFRAIGTVYRGDVEKYSDSRDINHPAMFPVHFAETYIEACTNSSESVYEPFCGSGTTLIACEKTGRICYGMELDEHYCSVIIKRYEDYSNDKAVKL